jgi:hypothetical protein
MIKKTIGYYSDTLDAEPGTGKLVLEIGDNEVACMVKSRSGEPLDGFELFAIESHDKGWENTLSEIQSSSRLLSKTYQETACYYNCEEAMIIPAEKFTTAAAEDYLALVYGEKYNCDTKHDMLKDRIVNSYRVQRSMHDLLGRHFVLYKPHHSFSGILDDVLSRENLPSYLVKLQVYSKHAILCLVKEGQLQLIRFFHCKSPEDILYYLTSLLQQFPVTRKGAVLELSGMLPKEHHSFSRLFGEVNYDEILQQNSAMAEALTAYPAYYFTPFFKLAV